MGKTEWTLTVCEPVEWECVGSYSCWRMLLNILVKGDRIHEGMFMAVYQVCTARIDRKTKCALLAAGT